MFGLLIQNRFAIALLAFAALSAGGAAVEAQPASKPNVIIFLVDDMGIMDCSVPFLTSRDETAGAPLPKRYPLNDFYRTPNIERLAALGVRFNNFYAMSVCSPTRISILTGQNAARHRSTNWIHSEQNNRGPHGPVAWNWDGPNSQTLTLPRLLQRAGYRTIHVGKAHFGRSGSDGADPLRLGFDVNVAGGAMGHPASYYGTDAYGNGAEPNRNAVPLLEKYHGTETFLTEALTREAMTHITHSVENGQPFFLNMAHYAVHSPFQSDPRFAPNYASSGMSEKAQAYATLIEGIDKSLGDLLDHLNTLGVAEDTLIFFLGDNGSDAPLGDAHEVTSSAPLRGKKGTHYEGGMRTPLIAAWGKRVENNRHQTKLPIPSGSIHEQIATVQDLFPTITHITNAQIPADHKFDGQDLNRMLQGEFDDSRDNTFLMHYPHSHRSSYFTSLRKGGWKVVYHYFPSELSGGSHYELFHLASDPFEETDLSESNPLELESLITQLVKQLDDHDALYPIASVDEPRALKPLVPRVPSDLKAAAP